MYAADRSVPAVRRGCVRTWGAIAVWARTEESVLGAAVGEALAVELASGAGIDVHAADQLLVYLALAGGGSYTARVLTPHAHTAMWLIELFLPIRFMIRETGDLMHVDVVPTAR
ncbi:MAG: RNA 3'-terminal phosphate cyclase [Burkholderiales bacterium]